MLALRVCAKRTVRFEQCGMGCWVMITAKFKKPGAWFVLLLIIVFLVQCDGLHLFVRNLIRYDDHRFIAGFRDLGIRGYFADWLWRKETYAFPLRDLTYFADFWIEDISSLRTYLFQNIIIFLLYGTVLFRVARRLLPAWWALAVTAVVMMHPISVQCVQWASARKHLMTALIAMTMVYFVLARSAQKRCQIAAHPNMQEKLTWRDFIALFFMQLGIGLSYVSGNLAFVAPTAFAFGLFPKQRKGVLLFALGAGGLSVGLAKFFVNQNQDFLNVVGTIFLGSDVFSLCQVWGRMVWNLFFPTHTAIYYSEISILNYFGMAFFAVSLVGLGVAFFCAAQSQKKHAFALAAGAVALALPQAAFIVGMREFLATDRYLFLAFPYALLCAAVLLQSYVNGKRIEKFAGVAVVALLGWYAVVSFSAVADWRSESNLFRSCTATESSSKCWAMRLEMEYNHAGCPAVYELFEPARKMLNTLPHDEQTGMSLKADLPLYEGLCAVTVSNETSEARMKSIDALMAANGEWPGYSAAKILLLLEMGQHSEASLLLANATVGSIGRGFSHGHDMKTIQYFYGMAGVMCQKSSLLQEVCATTLWPLLQKNLPPHMANNTTTQSAATMTMNAYVRGAR